MTSDAKVQQMHPILNVPMERMPKHVAIIMDGNGRWAQQRGLPREEGHRNGSKAVRATITESARIGLKALTLYSFSRENWKRPQAEVATLMELYRHYVIEERPTIMNNNIRVRHLGDDTQLPDALVKELHTTVDMSKNNDGMTLCLALNYSGRSELVDTVQRIARRVQSGELKPEQIDESTIDTHLDTVGLPDPDLLIRTSGEMRISNFLLWQIAYAELYVTDVHWPDFDKDQLYEAVRVYTNRHRRFGGLK